MRPTLDHLRSRAGMAALVEHAIRTTERNTELYLPGRAQLNLDLSPISGEPTPPIVPGVAGPKFRLCGAARLALW